ncbi:MAG: hypothetical protein CM15mP116_06410 [Synechococcus sp.]|nr:MAG: hypothetical protein CM15mP116_06410 [Synechococcus sp.]
MAHPRLRPVTRLFWRWSEALLDPLRPRDVNQALMDLGATLCTPRSPSCHRCPGSALRCLRCRDPCRWPVTDASKPLPFQVIGVGVVLNAAGEVLIDQRLEEGLLGGMWEFPGGKQEQGETIETCIARELKEELGIAVTVGDELLPLITPTATRSCASWCISATGSRGSRSPLPVSRCVGCGRMTWGITPFLPPMLGSLRLCWFSSAIQRKSHCIDVVAQQSRGHGIPSGQTASTRGIRKRNRDASLMCCSSRRHQDESQV